MSTDPPEQQQTLEQLRRGLEGDSETFAEIWDIYRERLRKLVKLRMDRRLQGRLDPSDVLQEAFVDFATRAKEATSSNVSKSPRSQAS